MAKNCIDGENKKKICCTKKGCHGKTAVVIGNKNQFRNGWSDIKTVKCNHCGTEIRFRINEKTGKTKVV